MAKIIQGIPIPDSQSPCDMWMTYHKDLKQKFGSNDGKVIWINSWNYAGHDSCALDSSFSKYFEREDIKVGNIATNFYGGALQLGSDIFGIVGNTAKVVKVLIPLTIAAVVVMGLFYIYRGVREVAPGQAVTLAAEGAAAGAVPG